MSEAARGSLIAEVARSGWGDYMRAHEELRETIDSGDLTGSVQAAVAVRDRVSVLLGRLAQAELRSLSPDALPDQTE